MTYHKPKGDVEFCMIDTNGKIKKRPFAYSTIATSELIVLLSQDGCTIKELYDKINYDKDAMSIIYEYINNGVGHLIAKDYFK